MRKGIAVSPGVVVGTAYVIHEIFVNPETKRLEDKEVTAELAAYETAREHAAADLRALQTKVESQVGHDEAAIFAVHEAILRDADFTVKIRDWIVNERMTAQAALHQLMNHYTSLFARTRDEYLKERLNDVRDVIERISGHLSDVLKPDSQALVRTADRRGRRTAAVAGRDARQQRRARHRDAGRRPDQPRGDSRPQPRHSGRVAACAGILRHVKTGDIVVVDGRDGHVIINPDAGDQQRLSQAANESSSISRTSWPRIATSRPSPPTVPQLELLANINSVTDAQGRRLPWAPRAWACFAPSTSFSRIPTCRTKNEQLAAYREIIDASPNHHVTIRTLDLGGDKTIPYLGITTRKPIRFMGWRSIRLSFEHPEFFTHADSRDPPRRGACPRRRRRSADHVSDDHDARGNPKLRRWCKEACSQLKRQRKEILRRLPIGMMLEVPAAAISIEQLLPQVDFVSIGSNDLVQYLMAADRDNPEGQPSVPAAGPPVLRVLTNVIDACNAARTPVTLCGEMAGQPRAFVLLFGMGLRSFSMSPAFIPTIKELAAHLSHDKAQQILEHALNLKTTSHVKRYLAEQLRAISPRLAMLDTA